MNHPAFPGGARVAVVERRDVPGALGVAMLGGRYVVPLPAGYDQRTQVAWVQGWIFVIHPDQPTMLADTTTGELGPTNDSALAAMLAAYEAPQLVHGAH